MMTIYYSEMKNALNYGLPESIHNEVVSCLPLLIATIAGSVFSNRKRFIQLEDL
jgi:hypothetical protein